MEQAVRNLGFINDENVDGRVTDDLARYLKSNYGADSVVIMYYTHDANGSYALIPALTGYADRAAVSYWTYNHIVSDISHDHIYKHEILTCSGHSVNITPINL